MNDPNAEIHGLLWKETRQLLPLMAIVIGTSLLLLMFWSDSPSSLPYLPLIMPALYAAGAAAVLVGQERESKTLWWMVSLPVVPSRVILVKFVVALVGLSVMWLIAWLLSLLVTPRTAPTWMATTLPLDYGFLSLHSVLVLACGFYTAWKIRNTFASLILIVPLASMPILLVHSVTALREWLTGVPIYLLDSTSTMTWVLTAVAIPTITALAYRAGQKTLSPAEPPKLTSSARGEWLDAWRPSALSVGTGAPYRSSISSLVWQSIHHNAVVLAGIAAMILFGLICLVFFCDDDVRRGMEPWLVFGILAATVGTCWLGVFVFTGDGSSGSLRFLAERGISPTRAWIGRHLIGLSVLSLGLLVYAVFSLLMLSRTSPSDQLPMPSVAVVTLVLWVGYSISQWTSQLLRMLAASAFLAPLLSVVTVVWFNHAASEYEAPLWLLILCSMLPMVATWLMMRRFMDGSRGLSTWLTAMTSLLLVIGLPAIPLAVAINRVPAVSASILAKRMAEARKVWQTTGPSQSILLTELPQWNLDNLTELTVDEAVKLYEQSSFRPQDCLLFGGGDSADGEPARIDRHVLNFALNNATHEAIRFQSAPNDDAAIESLGAWIDTLTRIARGLRQSRHWWDQDNADLIEIWLTNTLSEPAMEKLMARDFSVAALQLIADKPGRDRARRRGVLGTWYSHQHPSFLPLQRYDLTGFEWNDGKSRTMQSLLRERRYERIVDAALRLIDAGSSGQPIDPLLRELHQLVVGPRIQFEDGPYSKRFRDTNVIPWRTRPAATWYGPWENVALRLAQRHGVGPVLQTPATMIQ